MVRDQRPSGTWGSIQDRLFPPWIHAGEYQDLRLLLPRPVSIILHRGRVVVSLVDRPWRNRSQMLPNVCPCLTLVPSVVLRPFPFTQWLLAPRRSDRQLFHPGLATREHQLYRRDRRPRRRVHRDLGPRYSRVVEESSRIQHYHNVIGRQPGLHQDRAISRRLRIPFYPRHFNY